MSKKASIRNLVSKKKKRYQRDGFDLDLTYITDKIIAMGFPAQYLEGLYRNHVDDVVKFFNSKHNNKFRIYNLCNERQIDQEKFDVDSINHQFPFNDHNPPEFSQMIACCQHIKNYLNEDIGNVVAIQCKAGKGRTGVIVCAVLRLLGYESYNASKILEFYGKKRTSNGKGVTIPSQIRYVYYYDHYLANDLEYTPIELTLVNMFIEGIQQFISNGSELQVVVYMNDDTEKGNLKVICTSPLIELKKDSSCVNVPLNFVMAGDIKFQFIIKSTFPIKKEKLCHCWLNTFFVVNKPPVTQTTPPTSNAHGTREAHAYKLNQMKQKQQQKFLRSTSDNRTIDEYDGDDDEGDNYKDNPDHNKVFQVPKFGIVASKPLEKTLSLSHSKESADDGKLYKVTLKKHEIDKANKDTNHRQFSKNFSITFNFAQSPKQSCVQTSDARSNQTHDKEDEPIVNDNLSESSESSNE